MKLTLAAISLLSVLRQAEGLYVVASNDSKCPYGSSTRLFKLQDQTLDSCYLKCYDTETCNYFSFGSDSSAYPGVCMGCVEGAILEPHAGFTAFELTEKKEFPPLPAVLADNDVKCAFGEHRVFKHNDQALTLRQCHEKCYDTPECHYYSWGTMTSGYPGVCIGCDEDSALSGHAGFDAYALTEKQAFPTEAPVHPSTCLADGDTFTTNGCDYEAILDGLNNYLEENECGEHDAQAVLDDIFPDSSIDAVESVCANAWLEIPTSTFNEVDGRFNDEFMENYINGDTFLNTETGTFQGTVEGQNIDEFHNDEAKRTVVQSIPSLETCEYNSMMCCFGRDRQPNDNNGNCADPIETNCINARPADNSNLCWTETDMDYFDGPFTFPGNSEGAIHCHGLAWADDENSFESKLRFNNLFYVSLYDHMYQRGYVETAVDSDDIAMCGCVEDMSKVSRADCTQVDVVQSFEVAFLDGELVATPAGEMEVEFNACQGTDPSNGNREDNDLASYVYRLNQDGRLSDDTMDTVFETLVGYDQPNNNQNEEACENAYTETFSEPYPDNVANLKCPFADQTERLFRTEDYNPLSLEECQALCYDTPFCQYFSIGINERQYKGVCIGCTADAVLEVDNGFNSYEMTETQQFPTAAPTPGLGDLYELVGSDVKCPFDGTRIFKDGPNISRTECYQECVANPNCDYFTFGEGAGIRDEWKGLCMGCTADAVLQVHAGFNTYGLLV